MIINDLIIFNFNKLKSGYKKKRIGNPILFFQILKNFLLEK